MTGSLLDTSLPRYRLSRPEPEWRREARLAAMDWLSTHTMPTRHDELWRYSPVDELTAQFSADDGTNPVVEIDPDIIHRLAGDFGGPRLVFINGSYAPFASTPSSGAGVSIGPFSDLSRTAASRPDIEFDRLDGFAVLNHLAGDDGALVEVSAATEVEAPLHIVHVAAPEIDTGVVTHPHCVVRLAEGARATVIESYVGLRGSAFTNAVTVVDIAECAELTYHRVQAETDVASHLGHVRVRVGRSGHLSAKSFCLGAQIARIAFDVTADGDKSVIEIDGLYLPSGTQHHDHVITIEHGGSHTSSNQRFKGVVDDHGRGSFTGQIIVRPGVVDTSAHQTNHSLLLTSFGESDTRPWLEILADDVNCTHGATIGRLDDAALFYLRSRGIPELEARHMLIEAFAREITDAVTPESFRDHLTDLIASNRHGAEAKR